MGNPYPLGARLVGIGGRGGGGGGGRSWEDLIAGFQCNKQFLQVPGLCDVPFASYLPKLSTQIYKAQYGDAIFVSFRGTQIWPL